jgi:DNA primase
MPGIDFDVLRAEVTMGQVLEQLGFQATTQTGSQMHGPCPLHGSTSKRSRSFSVNVDIGRYYCHKCESRGNQLELWAAANRLPLYEAAIDLRRVLGLRIGDRLLYNR